MKKRLLLIFLMLGMFPVIDSPLISAGDNTLSHYLVETKSQCVYYCTGPKAKRFHKSPYCKGLSKCSGSIVECSKEEASRKGFTPCKICYKR